LMSDNVFVTKSSETAAFLAFVRPDLWKATRKVGVRSCVFEFADPQACMELQKAYHANAGVDDLKSLFQCMREVRDSFYLATNSPDGICARVNA
jgi:hypothetical protein